MRTVLLLAMITVSEAAIGVFVRLVDGRIPIATLNLYALAFATAFLLVTVPRATGRPLDLPTDNLRDTLIIGVLIATQISVFNYAMTLAPIANVVTFWSVAPIFRFLFAWAFLGERRGRSYAATFVLALAGIVIAKPLATIAYPALGVELPVLLWAAGFGIVSTGVAYLGIAMVLRRMRADTYTLVDVIVSPVVAATSGWLVFGEAPGTGMIVGGAILLASDPWLSREMVRRRAEAGAA